MSQIRRFIHAKRVRTFILFLFRGKSYAINYYCSTEENCKLVANQSYENAAVSFFRVCLSKHAELRDENQSFSGRGDFLKFLNPFISW